MPPPHSSDSDPFLQIGEASTGFLEEHLKTILAVIAILVLIALGWVMMMYSQENKRIDAQETLAGIVAIYPGNGTPLPDGIIQGAVDKYNAFIADNPAGSALYLAQLNLGMAHEELGDSAAAETAYRAAIVGPPAVAGAAEMRLGYLLMAGDDKKAAGDAFNRVISSQPGMAPQAALEIARMAELAGATDVAIEHYRRVMSAYANNPQAAEARVRIRALGGELPSDAVGVTPAGDTDAAPANETAAPAG
jgi:TolA-binding protein